MYSAFIYFQVTAGVCLLAYFGARLLAVAQVSLQNWLAAVLAALSISAAALFHDSLIASNACVIVTGFFAGVLLSRLLRSTSSLIAFFVSASIGDWLSVQAGPTRWLLASAQQTHPASILQYLAVSIQWKGSLISILGLGDLLFFTICIATSRRLNWPEAGILAVPLTGLFCALGVAVFTRLPMPAIPFLAVAVGSYACFLRFRKAPAAAIHNASHN